MGLDLPAVHAGAIEHTRSYVHAVTRDQWGLDTPCDDWDVHTLMNHVVAGNLWVAPLVAGRSIEEVGTRYDGDVLGEDPAAAYDASAEAAVAAFNGPGAMEAACLVSYGPVPGAVYCGHRIIDVLIHGWDLAIATGQDATLPPDLVDACAEIVAPQAEMLQGSGAFGTAHDTEPGQDAQAALLAQLGRGRST
jgi:uncharacterized protein (TIGR03086 family)